MIMNSISQFSLIQSFFNFPINLNSYSKKKVSWNYIYFQIFSHKYGNKIFTISIFPMSILINRFNKSKDIGTRDSQFNVFSPCFTSKCLLMFLSICLRNRINYHVIKYSFERILPFTFIVQVS